MHYLINQSSQSIRTRYFFWKLLSLIALRKISTLEEKKQKAEEKWKQEKEYTRI